MSGAWAYYNEIDPFCVSWLRELIKRGMIADGEVDSRSIRDVRPDDLAGFSQCHFFAGIGGWSYALRLAGWDDSRPVWTGSCPCQPFSAAGKRKGAADDRHLWPEFSRLIGECRPSIVLGEQVASKLGRAWLASVRSDVEAMGYALGAADLCAAGVGAPHIRQRLYWVADSNGGASRQRRSQHGRRDQGGHEVERPRPGSRRRPGRLADTDGTVAQQPTRLRAGPQSKTGSRENCEPHGRSGWSGCAWVACLDGKQRPIGPGTFPLAHGSAARVGRLRGYGNAIVPEVAAEFIRAADASIGGLR